MKLVTNMTMLIAINGMVTTHAAIPVWLQK